jgi:hypothetical protein
MSVLEPTLTTPWKLMVLGTGLLIFTMGYIAIGIAFWNRDYPPLKAKQIPVIFLSLVSATCWWTGSVQAYGIIQQTGIFRFCLLWGIWFQTVVGVQLHIAIYTFRILRLYFILVLGLTPTGFVFWSLVLSVWFPSIVMGFLPVAFPGKYFSTGPIPIRGFEDGTPTCDYFDPIYSNLLMLWALYGLLLLLFLNFKVSRVRAAFNEYNENKYGLLVLYLVLIVNFILGFGSQNFTWGQILMASNQLMASNSLFWFTMFKPLKGFLFRKKEFLAEWGLREEKLPEALLYGVNQSSTSATGFSNNYSQSHIKSYS